MVNPTFPTTELSWGPLWNANGGAVPADGLVGLSGRSIGSISTGRGKQYELDQSQTGTLGAKLMDTDGALDPTNTAGPWVNRIKPYQPLRLRVQYPPCANLLLPGQASGGEGYSTGPIPASLAINSTCDPTGGQIVASGSAYQGSNVFQFAVVSGIASGSAVAWTRVLAPIPGKTYTVSMRVRNVAAGTTQGVKPRFAYYDNSGNTNVSYGSTVSLVGSTSAAWTQIQHTFTMPANTHAAQCGFVVSTTSVACSIQVDGWQLEEGSTATTWALPSPWYPLFAGFVERWSTEWRDAGSFGMVTPTGVDSFSLLAQRNIRDPLTEEMDARNPRFIYTLSDPQDVSTFADETGQCGPMGIGSSRLGPGTLTAGVTVTAADPVHGVWAANGGTVATLANSSPGTATAGPASFLTMPPGVNGPATGSWTRGIAFRYTGPKPTGSDIVALWTAGDQTFSPIGSLVAGTGTQVQITSTGRINFQAQQGGSGSAVSVSGTVADIDVTGGNWHLVLFGYRSDGTMMVSVDGHTYSPSGAPANMVVGGRGVSEWVGAWPSASTGGATAFNFSGDLAYISEFPSLLSSASCSAVYQAWKTAYLGDSTDQRYARILGWAGYSGATDIGTGQTRSMGAAKGGADALSLMQAVVDTESGNHWISPSGAVTFRGRASRYNSLIPTYVFGERTDLGEFPYEELTLDFDSTHLANAVEVTQAGTNQKFSASDATSQGAYFPRTMSRTVDSTDATEVQAAAGYLLSRYKDPKVRVTALRLHPGGNPALWPVCLALEIGNRVRVMRRAGAAPAIQLELFVEHLQWDLDDQNDAWLTLQLSPVDPTPYGLFSALHTTLNGNVSVGDPTFAINAPSGGSWAPLLGAMIYAGMQLVVEPGPNQEVVTVTSWVEPGPGWTAGSLTISGTFTKNHSVGSAVYHVLPAGITDPATWDSAAKFDSIAFSY